MLVARRGEHDRGEAGGLILQDDLPRLIMDIVVKLHVGIEKQEIRDVEVSSEGFPASLSLSQEEIEAKREQTLKQMGPIFESLPFGNSEQLRPPSRGEHLLGHNAARGLVRGHQITDG